jgi:hypothetical protein
MKGKYMDKCSVVGCLKYPSERNDMGGGASLCQEHWREWLAEPDVTVAYWNLRAAAETVRFWQCRVAGVMTEDEERRIEGKFLEALAQDRRCEEVMRELRNRWLAAHKVEPPGPAEPPPFVPPTEPGP